MKVSRNEGVARNPNTGDAIPDQVLPF